MPRHTTLVSDSFDGVWGYCAVVGTRELLWSGHRIPEPASLPELDDYVAALRDGLSLASPLSIKVFTDGAASWLAGELVEAGHRQINDGEDPAEGALIAAALSRVIGQRFFLVLLERNRAHHTLRATVEAIPVATPEDARDYILHHPSVLALEAEGMRRLQEREPAAAREPGADSFTCERLHGLLN
jgi:hypothetical protein